MLLLGVADAQALRPVLGDPFHEGAEPAGRRGALRQARGHVPAAASGGITPPPITPALAQCRSFLTQCSRGKCLFYLRAAHKQPAVLGYLDVASADVRAPLSLRG